MDWTPLQHTLIALVSVGIGKRCGNIYAGAAFGTALFIGREHAQTEYIWIEQLGGHLRSNMPWYGGFDPRVWTMGNMLDWLVPLVICVAATLFLKGLEIIEEDLKYY